MTDDTGRPAGGEALSGSGPADISERDQQALTDLFAALTADAPPSGISPLEVVKLGRAEVRSGLDRRVHRLNMVRNVAVAAAIATLVVIVGPKLVQSNSESSTAAVSGSSAAAAASAVNNPNDAKALSPAASSAAAGAAAPPAVNASSGSVVGGGQAGSRSAAAAASSGAPISGSLAASGSTADQTSAAASGEASVIPAPGSCRAVSGQVRSAVDKALAASSLTPSVITTCPASAAFTPPLPTGTYGLERDAPIVAVNVRTAPRGACAKSSPSACHLVAGTTDVYRTTSGDLAVWVYGSGREVQLSLVPPSTVGVDRLITAGRAVVHALG